MLKIVTMALPIVIFVHLFCIAGYSQADQASKIALLEDRIVVSTARESAYSFGIPPWQSTSFEKHIGQFEGKPISALIDLEQIEKIIKPQESGEEHLFRVTDLSNELIIAALQTGKVISSKEMTYALQFSREFIIQTPEEDVAVGIYYEPVGYIRLEGDESYWFLFSTEKNREENSADHPMIDSTMTFEEALDGLNSSCPEEIRNNQALIDVLYYSTDGLVHKGQIVVDQRLADDVKQAFQAAFDEKFPFTSVLPISQFSWDDGLSMAQNNTSGFNYREMTGGKKLSNHAYGFALDINPLFNPYIKGNITLPVGALYNPDQPGTLTADSAVVQAFLKLGWEWGGHWRSLKDYQHFEKTLQK